MAKKTVKDIVDLWHETQMGNMHKCMEKQHELDIYTQCGV